MSKDFLILISESQMAAHNAFPDKIDLCFISMNIPLNIKRNENFYTNGTQNLDNKEFAEIMHKYNSNKDKYKNIYIWIGFDADEQGEYMAMTLRDILVKNGISETQLLRTPFCSDKYIIAQDFKDMQAFLNFKGLEREFINYVRAHNAKCRKHLPTNLSLKKLISIRKLSNNANTNPKNPKTFKVLSNTENNTVTYITNFLKNKNTKNDGARTWITAIN